MIKGWSDVACSRKMWGEWVEAAAAGILTVGESLGDDGQESESAELCFSIGAHSYQEEAQHEPQPTTQGQLS